MGGGVVFNVTQSHRRQHNAKGRRITFREVVIFMLILTQSQVIGNNNNHRHASFSFSSLENIIAFLL